MPFLNNDKVDLLTSMKAVS